MFDRNSLLSHQNALQICKAASFLVLLLAHILLGTEVLNHNKMKSQALQGEPEPANIVSEMIAQRAPYFEGTAVLDNEFVTISLSKYAGKYIVLLFYPLDFSSVCPMEITAFSERLEEFSKLNAAVIACSVDSAYSHMTWLNMPSKDSGLGNIHIPLLSDLTHSISQDYGVYMPRLGHSLSAQFIIDPKGIVRQATINDLSLPRSVDAALRSIKACRYADKTGRSLPEQINS